MIPIITLDTTSEIEANADNTAEIDVIIVPRVSPIVSAKSISTI